MTRRLVALWIAVSATAIAAWFLAVPPIAAATPTNNPGSPPTISGAPVEGGLLTASPGGWTSTGTITYSYAWSDGTTGPTDVPSAADVGKTITVTVTASDGTPPDATATSAGVGPVTAPPVNTSGSPPKITGSTVQGGTLTAQAGGWTGYPAPTFSYAWSDGSKGPTDTLPAGDVGSFVSVTVTASNGVGSPVSATSASVGPVLGPPIAVPGAPPTINGTAQQGDMLSASPGGWTSTTPITFTYHWSDGTTGPTDTLSAADVGQSVTVTVTATNGGGSASATSASFGPVAPPPPFAVGTSTTLQAFPTSALTNESVLLIATVTSSDGSHPPSGTVTFKNGATSISACTNETVAGTSQSVTVTCKTSFGAANANLTAVFTPAAGSVLTASASPVDSYAIGRDSTTTSLDVSPTTNVGASTTYTASVNPPPDRPGPILPSGSVEFLDNGQPIPSCTNQPVSHGGATCPVTYQATGSHAITADYHGDTDFTGSLSPSESVNVLSGSAPRKITSTMQWTFYYSPTYTRVLALVINGVAGNTVLVSCHGRGCPFSRHSTHVKTNQRCGVKGKGACQARASMNLTSMFRNGLLRVGAQIKITITRSGWVGKFYSFTTRARTGPRIRISCLAPGAIQPGRGC
jgi:Bacterial Ig-like domain (group 3)